jgi:hypothetical protein
MRADDWRCRSCSGEVAALRQNSVRRSGSPMALGIARRPGTSIRCNSTPSRSTQIKASSSKDAAYTAPSQSRQMPSGSSWSPICDESSIRHRPLCHTRPGIRHPSPPRPAGGCRPRLRWRRESASPRRLVVWCRRAAPGGCGRQLLDQAAAAGRTRDRRHAARLRRIGAAGNWYMAYMLELPVVQCARVPKMAHPPYEAQSERASASSAIAAAKTADHDLPH